MENKKIEIKLGLSIWSILFIVFLVLKLFNIGAAAAWSWWVVFLPLIIPFGIIFVWWFMFLIIIFIKFVIEKL